MTGLIATLQPLSLLTPDYSLSTPIRIVVPVVELVGGDLKAASITLRIWIGAFFKNVDPIIPVSPVEVELTVLSVQWKDAQQGPDLLLSITSRTL